MLSAISSLEEYAQAIETVEVPFSKVENLITRKHNVQWNMARLDLLDEELSGNKLFKLLPFLLRARKLGITQLLSFGGVHSNHLHALAAAGKRFGFSTVGIVRGYIEQEPTETLNDIRQWGMHIRLAGKAEYARRYDKDYLLDLQAEYPDAFIIPEGGSGSLGLEGSRLMARVVARSLHDEPCMIALAMGTGTTFTGLLTARVFSGQSMLCGYSALKNADELNQAIRNELSMHSHSLPEWSVSEDYCFGGFARMDRKLALFIQQFENEQRIPLDPVYTAKLCYAIHVQIEQGIISQGGRVVSLHTGGLQGRRGMFNKIENIFNVGSQELC